MIKATPYWEHYNKTGSCGSDHDLLAMIDDVCNAYYALQKMDGNGTFALVYHWLANVYNGLSMYAYNRKLKVRPLYDPEDAEIRIYNAQTKEDALAKAEGRYPRLITKVSEIPND